MSFTNRHESLSGSQPIDAEEWRRTSSHWTQRRHLVLNLCDLPRLCICTACWKSGNRHKPANAQTCEQLRERTSLTRLCSRLVCKPTRTVGCRIGPSNRVHICVWERNVRMHVCMYVCMYEQNKEEEEKKIECLIRNAM